MFILYLAVVQDYKMFKNIILLLSIFGLTLADTLRSFPLNKELVDNFLSAYEESGIPDDGAIIAQIDKYADQLFDKIQTYSVGHNLDPIPLTNFSQNFLTAQILLNNGTLRGISSLVRNGDVKVLYSHTDRKLVLDVPFNLKNLNFTYDFKVGILILKTSGSMTGKIDDFTIDVKLNFDLKNYNATLEKIESPGMGKISLTFDGHGIVDSVINILSKFVTAILHPFLESYIESKMKSIAVGIVDEVNIEIDHFLHPNTTTSSYF